MTGNGLKVIMKEIIKASKIRAGKLSTGPFWWDYIVEYTPDIQ